LKHEEFCVMLRLTPSPKPSIYLAKSFLPNRPSCDKRAVGFTTDSK